MTMNEVYLKSGRSKESDECLTPRYAIMPVVKHLKAKGYFHISCPFDKEDSQFVRVLKENGFQVYHSHIEDDIDFFDFSKYDMQIIDCIVSNPPFSIKDDILKRLYELDTPFMMLLPQNSLQSIRRVDMFMKHGFEYLGFDRRVNYYTWGDLDAWKPANHFASGYFCKDVLSEKLIFEKLIPIQEPYI